MSTKKIITTDFSDFGSRERTMAENLLKASITQGFPSDFITDRIHIMFDKNSGYVFFTNEDFQIAMMNGDKLESFYSCPNCNKEGFKAKFESGKCTCGEDFFEEE